MLKIFLLVLHLLTVAHSSLTEEYHIPVHTRILGPGDTAWSSFRLPFSNSFNFKDGSYVELVSKPFRFPGSAWLRLKFNKDTSVLSEKEEIKIKITSKQDGYFQLLDRESLLEWNFSSAYFNGDHVTIQVFAKSKSIQESFLYLESVSVSRSSDEDPSHSPGFSLCHRLDQRKLSYSRKSARLMPVGCTSWMFDDNQHCFLSAGHCTPREDQDSVVQFQVPLSHPDGTVRHPHPSDQYALDIQSIQSESRFISFPMEIHLANGSKSGDDWLYFGVFPNSNTRLKPFEAQQDWYRLMLNTTQMPKRGELLKIVGYGITFTENDNFRNQVQQSHQGPLVAINPKNFNISYVVDTMGGNSGSAIQDTTSGLVIGIHTDAACSASGTGMPLGSNRGTFIGNTNLRKALRNPRGVCKPQV